jgi:hypothetical protein
MQYRKHVQATLHLKLNHKGAHTARRTYEGGDALRRRQADAVALLPEVVVGEVVNLA